MIQPFSVIAFKLLARKVLLWNNTSALLKITLGF